VDDAAPVLMEIVYKAKEYITTSGF